MTSKTDKVKTPIKIVSAVGRIGSTVRLNDRLVPHVRSIRYVHTAGDIPRLTLECLALDGVNFSGMADSVIYAMSPEVLYEIELLKKEIAVLRSQLEKGDNEEAPQEKEKES